MKKNLIVIIFFSVLVFITCKKDKNCPESIVEWAGYRFDGGVMTADKFCSNWKASIGGARVCKYISGKTCGVDMSAYTYHQDTSIFEVLKFNLPTGIGKFQITNNFSNYPDSTKKVYVKYSLKDDHTTYDPYETFEAPENYVEITVFDTINNVLEGIFNVNLHYIGLDSKPVVQSKELVFSNGHFKAFLDK
jgi:hypothetical protein